jgi:hypothetical protein
MYEREGGISLEEQENGQEVERDRQEGLCDMLVQLRATKG